MIRVTAAVIEKNNKILIAQRKKEKHLGLKWEFPGGKIEDGESPESCLRRELKEEFGIETKIKDFIVKTRHQYPKVEIELLAYNVQYISGEFKLIDHEKIDWVNKEKLTNYDFAEADLDIIEKITLSI
jgi:8-oxo-dGTP diphosphatase